MSKPISHHISTLGLILKSPVDGTRCRFCHVLFSIHLNVLYSTNTLCNRPKLFMYIYICVKSNASLHDINWLIHLLNKICLTSSEVFYTLISFTYFPVMPNFLRCTGSMYRDHLYSPVQASIYEADVASICPLLTFCDCSVPWDIGHSWPQNKSDPPHSSPHVCLGCSQIQIHAYKCRLAVHNYNSCIYI